MRPLLFSLAATAGLAAADDPAAPPAVKRLAETVAAATVAGDHKTVIALTYPPVVKEMGGADKAVAATAKLMDELRAKGITLTAVKVGEPGKPVTGGGKTYVVVPTRTELAAPQGTVRSKSFLLAISTDAGKTWTFADGTGLAKKAARDKVLPDLPAALTLPEREKPEVVPKGK